MTISIDFDKTWTADPELWRQFLELARSRGHTVVMVTAREDMAPDMERSVPKDLPIVFTNGEMKEFSALRQGWKVDVWIDDCPGMIQKDAYLQNCNETEL